MKVFSVSLMLASLSGAAAGVVRDLADAYNASDATYNSTSDWASDSTSDSASDSTSDSTSSSYRVANYTFSVDGYSSFDEYSLAVLSGRTFTFTGCSNVQGDYENEIKTYVTYRICDDDKDASCTNHQHGCKAYNGDFVANMNVFTEVFAEYTQRVNGLGSFFLECLRSGEFADMHYQMQLKQEDNEDGVTYVEPPAQENNDRQYYIGPTCSINGKHMISGVFLDSSCTMPSKNHTLSSILGFTPQSPNVESCLSCIMEGDNSMNPLCEPLMESSGRCVRNTRKSQSSEMDEFWRDMVQFEKQDNEVDEDAYTSYYWENTCTFIDDLPHSTRLWNFIEGRAAKNNLTGIAYFGIVLVSLILAVGLVVGLVNVVKVSLQSPKVSKQPLMDLEGGSKPTPQEKANGTIA